MSHGFATSLSTIFKDYCDNLEVLLLLFYLGQQKKKKLGVENLYIHLFFLPWIDVRRKLVFFFFFCNTIFHSIET